MKHFKLVILCTSVKPEHWAQNCSTCSSALQAKQIAASAEWLLWLQEEEMHWEEQGREGRESSADVLLLLLLSVG